MTTGIRIVAFDFDGTVVDSMGGFADLAGEILAREHGLSVDEGRRRYRDTSGLPFFLQLDELFPSHPDNPRLAAEFEARKLEGFFRQTWFPDVPDALSRLRAGGVITAVCSNNSEENVRTFVQRRRAETGVTFDHVLGFRPGFQKGPPHFDHLLQVEGATRDQLLLVGDSLKDAEKAVSYGIGFVARTGTFGRADFEARFPGFPVVDTLAALPSLLGLP